MKEKISLILVLGIVGVLVVSFIIDSRASATLMRYEIEVDGDTIGYVEMPPIGEIMGDILDEWSTEDVVWEYVNETEDLGNYTGALTAAVGSNGDIGYALGILDDLPGNVVYYGGFDETDLVPDYAHWIVPCSVAEDQSGCGANYRVGTLPGGREVVVFIDWSQSGYGDSGYMRYDVGTGDVIFF